MRRQGPSVGERAAEAALAAGAAALQQDGTGLAAGGDRQAVGRLRPLHGPGDTR